MPAHDDLRAENAYLKALPRFVLRLDQVGLSAFVLETAAEIVSSSGGALVVVSEGRAVVAACRGLAKDVVARVHTAASGAPSSSSAAARVAATLGAVAGDGKKIIHAPILVGKDVVGHCLLILDAPPGEPARVRLAAFLEEAGVALQQALIVHSAAFDRNTGVHTQEYFLSRLEEEVTRAARYKRRLALLLFELDRWSILRDVHGPVVADFGLRASVEVFRTGLRRVDIIGRFREHGFGILLPETGLNSAFTIGKRLARQVSEAGLQDGSRWVELSSSGAVTSFPQDGGDLDTFWQRSTDLLDAAVRQGGGKVLTRRDQPADPGESAEAAAHNEIDQLVLSKEGRALLGMVARMAAGRDMGVDAMQTHIITTLVEIGRCDRGALVLLDREGFPDPPTLRFADRAPSGEKRFSVDLGLLRRAVEERHTLAWNHRPPGEEEDPISSGPAPHGRKRRAYLCSPIVYSKQPIGVVMLEHAAEGKGFSPDDVDLVASALEVLGGILHAARAEERRQREFIEVKEKAERALHQLEERFAYSNIIGKSKSMQNLFGVLERVAETSHAVLIQGESGTGKELVARALHYNGPRLDKPFIAENCAALPATLLEAELFGYVKGAFTGATSNKKGLLEVAHGGTMFLDEIGDMAVNLQKKLLRVLEEKEFRPLGAKQVVRMVDVRFIAATNRDLKKLIADGSFREDLFYRLNVVNILLPPLRERKEDLPLLVEHFLQVVAEDTGQPKKQVANDAMRMLMAHDWPGNIRELENTFKNVCVFSDGPLLSLSSFAHLDKFRSVPADAPVEAAAPPADPPPSYPALLGKLAERERAYIREVIAGVQGNKLQAAKLLGLTRPALYRALKRLKLE